MEGSAGNAGNMVILDPMDSLTFTLISGNSSQAALTISNTHVTENIAFKVKTTRPMRYLVRPNQGVVAPKSNATVLLILQQKDCDELLRLEPSKRQLSIDKFLVQSMPVETEFCEKFQTELTKKISDDLLSIWAHADKNIVVNMKIQCKFVESESTTLEQQKQSRQSLSEAKENCSNNSNEFSSALLKANTSVTVPAENVSSQDNILEVAVLRKKYDEVNHDT